VGRFRAKEKRLPRTHENVKKGFVKFYDLSRKAAKAAERTNFKTLRTLPYLLWVGLRLCETIC
jgi:hypothetical protein